MSNEINKDWSHWIREDDESYTQSGFGSKRQTKSGTKTAVDTHPQMRDAKAMTDDKGTKGFDKGNDPARNRPGHVDFPQQRGPSPQSRWKDSWAKAGLEQSTREAQRRQSGNYTNRKS